LISQQSLFVFGYDKILQIGIVCQHRCLGQ
jgi:hypothetical protein